MSALAVSPAYSALLAKLPPRVVRSDAQNDAYIEALYELDQRSAELSSEERDLADLLTLLVEDYEAQQFALPRASPIQTLAFLMDQHQMKQKDLAGVLGTASIVSEVLRGKRELTKNQIQRLAARFSVSVELFF